MVPAEDDEENQQAERRDERDTRRNQPHRRDKAPHHTGNISHEVDGRENGPGRRPEDREAGSMLKLHIRIMVARRLKPQPDFHRNGQSGSSVGSKDGFR